MSEYTGWVAYIHLVGDSYHLKIPAANSREEAESIFEDRLRIARRDGVHMQGFMQIGESLWVNVELIRAVIFEHAPRRPSSLHPLSPQWRER